jgi:hypothetical protein
MQSLICWWSVTDVVRVGSIHGERRGRSTPHSSKLSIVCLQACLDVILEELFFVSTDAIPSAFLIEEEEYARGD